MNISTFPDTSASTVAASSTSLADMIANERAFAASAEAAGVSGRTWEAMYALRHAADFLDQAAHEIASGSPIDAREVVERFQWGVMKVVEFNGMLPGEVQGDLSAECFQR